MALAPHIRVVDDDLRRTARSASDGWKQRIGTAVKACRERAGLSQAALADLVGANLSTISDIERGVSVPALSTAWAIADRLGVTLDDLVGRVTQQSLDAEEGQPSPIDRVPPGPTRDVLLALQGQIDALRDMVPRAKGSSPGREKRRSA